MPQEMKDDDSSAKVYYRSLSGRGHQMKYLERPSESSVVVHNKLCHWTLAVESLAGGLKGSLHLILENIHLSLRNNAQGDDEDSSAKVYYRRLSGKEPSVEIFGASGLLNLLWLYITSFVTGHSPGKVWPLGLEASFHFGKDTFLFEKLVARDAISKQLKWV
ncbi:hypothetical protein CDAR_457321 [Caerostris darwini]|uniref:Uncharacterized protein n=1 Tax=Caerostris darwini TaxID=1538125 RepID=A0AAV4PFH5_9ARAC|nr:hypothetical protein CDAR_457321 [Caerostris darwini]